MAISTKSTVHQTLPDNQKPVARVATDNITAVIGSIIQLDGRRSSDPEGKSLTYSWAFLQVPLGSLLTSSSFKSIKAEGSAVSFVPDKTGLYLVSLTVSDGLVNSDPVSVSINIQVSRVPCGDNIVPDASFLWTYLSDFWNLVEDKDYLSSVWSASVQMLGAELQKLWTNDYNKSIKTIQGTVQRRWLSYSNVTDVSDLKQSVIAGRTSHGTGGLSGPTNSKVGVGYTAAFRVKKGSPETPGFGDFQTLRGNYGPRGRVLVAGGFTGVIDHVADVLETSTGTVYSQAILKEKSFPEGMVGTAWRIPHLLAFPGTDIWGLGIRPGDTVVFDCTRKDTGQSAELKAQVVGVLGDRLGFEWTLEDLATTDDTVDSEMFKELMVGLRIANPKAADIEILSLATAFLASMPVGVNLAKRPFSAYQVTITAKKILRNSIVVLDDKVTSIPALQESLKDPPVVLRENLDYTLEDSKLQYVDGLFTPKSPAPETLYAECTFIDNSDAIESNFGSLVSLSKDDLSASQTRAPYLSAVKGLMYAMMKGPTIGNIRLGLQILLGLPFTEETGVILEIVESYSTDTYGNTLGRLLIEDVDSNYRKLGVRRSYLYPASVNLETNPATGKPFAVGDLVERFTPLSKGVEVVDYLKDPYWWVRVYSGLEILKYTTLKFSVDSSVFDYNDAAFALRFVKTIKAAYTKVIAEILKELSDDIVVSDSLGGNLVVRAIDDITRLEACQRAGDTNDQGVLLWPAGGGVLATRTPRMLTDLRTYVEGGYVFASSASGFGGLVRGRSKGDSIIEGDLLAILPGQPGASFIHPGLYEIDVVVSDTVVRLLREAPWRAPELNHNENYGAVTALNAAKFFTGSGLLGTVVRRQRNPILVGTGLETTADSVAMFTEDLLKAGVELGDHLIIESGAAAGEYVLTGLPVDSIPQIRQHTASIVGRYWELSAVVGTGQDFRVVRPRYRKREVWNCALAPEDTSLVGLTVVDAGDVTAQEDVFSPWMVGFVVHVTGSAYHDGDWMISEYRGPGSVQLRIYGSTDPRNDTVLKVTW